MLRSIVDFSNEKHIDSCNIRYYLCQIDGLFVGYFCKLSRMCMNTRNNQKHEYDYCLMKRMHDHLQGSPASKNFDKQLSLQVINPDGTMTAPYTLALP
jgi:hypothetical protein